MKNFARRGRKCVLFLSHAWNEPVFEFVRHALEAWPVGLEECGAYFCVLSNPQNLDISCLLGATAEDSPFYRILTAPLPPRELIMVTNSLSPIHDRLWCVSSAS